MTGILAVKAFKAPIWPATQAVQALLMSIAAQMALRMSHLAGKTISEINADMFLHFTWKQLGKSGWWVCWRIDTMTQVARVHVIASTVMIIEKSNDARFKWQQISSIIGNGPCPCASL